MRTSCSTFGDAIAGVRVSDDSFIVIAAELTGNGQVEASTTVGSDGASASRISAQVGHFASTAPDIRSFEKVLEERLAEVGVRGRNGDGGKSLLRRSLSGCRQR